MYKTDNIRNIFKQNKKAICISFIILCGIILRCFNISNLPHGLNCDEASSAYEAYSIMNYGIDRNGNFLPVFLQAWGSGQNALYSYIMMPFIKLFGLNIISTRLPMALIGSISLIVWYKLLKNIKNDKFAIIGLIFLVICPWHIMKSRWGLESNVFPDLILWAIYLIIKFLENKKVHNLYLASVILGLTGYSYGTAYFFLPIFVFSLFAYLLLKKEIKIRNVIISGFIIFVITLPIMLYVLINTFGLEQINLPFMTIPKLPVNRYEEQTSLFSGNVLLNAFENIKNSISLIIFQDDNLAWNNVSGFGMYYLISILFLIIGLIFSFTKNKLKCEYDNIFNIWFVSAFLLLFVFKEANINRINILIFPLIYYIVIGLNLLIEKNNKIFNVAIIVVYILLFFQFMFAYGKQNQNEYWTFADNIKDVIEYVDMQAVDNIYFEYAFKEPYIYVLFYTKYNTRDFVNSVQHFDENNLGKFENVKSFGKYKFYLPEKFDEENSIYVISKNSNIEIDYKKFDVKEFEKFNVLSKKNV